MRYEHLWNQKSVRRIAAHEEGVCVCARARFILFIIIILAWELL